MKEDNKIGLIVDSEDIDQVIFTHELFTGSRLATIRGTQYSKKLTAQVYKCSNWHNCQFQLKVRQYIDEDCYRVSILHPHNHTKQKEGKIQLVSHIASNFFKKKRADFDIAEAKKEFEEFTLNAIGQQDVIGNLQRELYPESSLPRVTGYVFEELLPADIYLKRRQLYYLKQQQMLNLNGQQNIQQQNEQEIQNLNDE